MRISNGVSQNIAILTVAVLIIIVGSVYYFGRYKYGIKNPPANIPSATPATPNPQGTYPVSVKNFVFNPAVLNINAGDTVTWTNNDSAAHRISGAGFQSSDLSKGQSYSFTFTSAGTFDYICAIHPSIMKGEIIVK